MATEVTTQTKEYIRPMPGDWWLKNPVYARFMIRELSSVFIAGYCIFLMVFMYRAEHSAKDFQDLHDTLTGPLSVVLHVLVLIFALYHTITFFNLTPRALVFRWGEDKVPDRIIAGAHYLVWISVTATMVILLMVVNAS